MGDYVLAKATQILASIGDAQVIILLAKVKLDFDAILDTSASFFQVIEDLVRGEFMQIGVRENEVERFDHYISKTFKKTASLFAHSCKAVVIASFSFPIYSLVFSPGRTFGERVRARSGACLSVRSMYWARFPGDCFLLSILFEESFSWLMTRLILCQRIKCWVNPRLPT